MDAVLFLKFIEYWRCYTNSMTLNQHAVETMTAALWNILWTQKK